MDVDFVGSTQSGLHHKDAKVEEWIVIKTITKMNHNPLQFVLSHLSCCHTLDTLLEVLRQV